MRILKTVSLIFFTFIISPYVRADNLYDASLFERDGRIEDAIPLYDQWLKDNIDDERFSEVLFHCASIIPSIEKTIQFLFTFENNIKERDKQNYYLRIAQIYELLFRTSEASIYYGIASTKIDGHRDYEIYLKHLQLEYQTGLVPDLKEINNILLSNLPPNVHVDALIFKSEIMKYNGDLTGSESILLRSEYRNSFPEIYYALWEIYLLQNDFTEIQKIVKILNADFPHSVELAIIEGDITELPRLSDYFIKNKQSVQLSYIQIGTFSNPENVRMQSELLKQYNFDFFYIEEGISTKIVVRADSLPEELLLKLKSKGFDGFKINYP